MKFIIVLISVIGLGCGTLASPMKAPASRGINEDLDEFIALLPLDEILNIVISYLGDPEVQQVIEYVFGEEFKALVIEVESIPEYNAVIDFIDDAGLPVKKWIAALHELLGIPTMMKGTTSSRSLKELIDEIRAIIDWDELEAFYYHKLETSPEFKHLFDQLGSPEFKGFSEALAANPRIQEISAQLTAAGLDIAGFIKLLKEFFGLN